jgi:hypothetical protein
MKAWHYMTNEDVSKLALEALDVACKHIQDIIGVDTGDLAGLYFSGENLETVDLVLRRYITLELQEKNPALHKFLGESNRAAQ